MREDPEGKRPCLRCLIAEMPDATALAEIIAQRIEQLPPEERTEEAERQRRLAQCRRCPHLRMGTCGLCGCYVEIRAAKTRLGCPDVPARWQIRQNCEENITDL